MNFLAHLLLSGDNADMQLGGWLGDFVKGPLSGQRPTRVEQGIQLHRLIDGHCDSHPLVHRSVARLGPSLRRVGGIAIDLCYDHFLARHWADYHHQPLDDYCRDIYALLQRQHTQLPPAARQFSERAREFRLLESYRELVTLEVVLTRMAGRLKRPMPLADCYPQLQRHYGALEADFRQLFPQLQAFARQQPGYC